MANEAYPFDNFLANREIDPSLCFILSPIKPEFSGIFKIIQELAEEFGLNCVRADQIARSETIHSMIWEHIQRAVVIIADITDSNPNVMFELGVACSIKENFRVIFIKRTDKKKLNKQEVPFDIASFKYVTYETSIDTVTDFRNELKKYFKNALSENSMFSTLGNRMEEWEKSNHHYSLVPHEGTLWRVRRFSGIKDAPKPLLAYFLSGAIQHGTDLLWWAELNKSNPLAAECAAELLLGQWRHPQFRAAFALQIMDQKLKDQAIERVRALTKVPFVANLLNPILEGKMEEFLKSPLSGITNETERDELLQNIVPHTRVKLNINY